MIYLRGKGKVARAHPLVEETEPAGEEVGAVEEEAEAEEIVGAEEEEGDGVDIVEADLICTS